MYMKVEGSCLLIERGTEFSLLFGHVYLSMDL